jgi:hypothetical protein
VAVCSLVNTQHEPSLISDGANGAIVVWSDLRTGDQHIYAQRLDPTGTTLWVANGEMVCTAQQTQAGPLLVDDGAGGAIIAWYDMRWGESDIYAQRVDDTGAMLWTHNGAVVCSASGSQSQHHMAGDGYGGAVITWYDWRGADSDIYAQRVDSNGQMLWTADGVPACTADGNQSKPRTTGAGDRGTYIGWEDDRASVAGLYVQLLDPDGAAVWTTDGEAISTASSFQQDLHAVSDDAGGAIFTWQESRSGIAGVYAQRIGPHGYLGDPAPMVTEAVDYPDDQGSMVVLSWTHGYLDAIPHQIVTHYSVWMRMPEEAAARAGVPERSGWAHVENVEAHYFEEYACNVPAYGNYTGSGDIPWTEYMVMAETDDQWVYWSSAVASGYAVDNLAPGAPLNLTGTPSGADALLDWEASGHHDEDLFNYRVYRGDTPGFTADAGSLIGTATGTSYTDTAPGPGTWYYRVTGEDAHQNEGLPSNEASATVGSASTLAAAISCLPDTGTLPFTTRITVTLDNLYNGQTRRLAGRINLALGSGGQFSNWRGGYTNVAAGSSYVASWNQNLPALGSLLGNNVFTLVAEDITPAPYNQPPYPPSGDGATDACTVNASAP